MSKVLTNWAEATQNANKAMIALVSCVENGLNAWIELRENGDQKHPIKIKNPELDNPFNWTMLSGTTRPSPGLLNHNFFNETEKDLTYNWTACFGEEKAIAEYQKNRIISKELFGKAGICHPVRIEDANNYRKNIVGDNYDYSYWLTYWKPKEGIPYWVVDKNIGKVFTICYTKDPVDKAPSIRKAAQFLLDYADWLQNQDC